MISGQHDGGSQSEPLGVCHATANFSLVGHCLPTAYNFFIFFTPFSLQFFLSFLSLSSVSCKCSIEVVVRIALSIAMFPSTNLYAHFGIALKTLDGNTKMLMNSKNVHKNVCTQLSKINFLSVKKTCT